jgi:hypothetical protein
MAVMAAAWLTLESIMPCRAPAAPDCTFCDYYVSGPTVWAADNQNIIDDMPLLAKPSVRFRKTINTVWVNEADRTQRRVMSVNAQHYAVLVTDVKQWPYPEMQWCVGRLSQWDNCDLHVPAQLFARCMVHTFNHQQTSC